MPGIYIETYGCQQNEADSEKILGMAEKIGYTEVDTKEEADLIVVNTCAVREHAELKALSNTGQLKHIKEKNPDLIIAVCGCMIQQEHRKEDIKNKYPYVDFIFGTNMTDRFPDLLAEVKKSRRRRFFLENYSENSGAITEGIPVKRKSTFKAWVSIMYGCNNFCSYCIVPYVRGRERSRSPERVISEVKGLIESGYRDITLLGQNVNSYGNDFTTDKITFAELLRRISSIPGDYQLRFMTSNPKDATRELIDVMGSSEHIAPHFHLPLQSGSDRVLAGMNRRYTRAQFLTLTEYMHEKIPGLSITTDIIVGFPGETEEDFLDTLDMLERIRFDGVFSFVYSRRKGTPASEMTNQIPDEIKKERMARLLKLQTEIQSDINSKLVGKTLRSLVDGVSKSSPERLSARSLSGKLIHFSNTAEAEKLIGSFADIKITSAEAIMLFGELV
ncbi:MAG: tRNA (N6-isopentenyl adenosine(37)-C2)-methylthiotransferase MiaB [Oscillospiraceae bacterium]|nr:tRNA (N6-isopentenyl adenosine(37)-C2)-methylthiotransferase MiaB [Oscillospiraceae bacterium]